jgi:hypothetical protein
MKTRYSLFALLLCFLPSLVVSPAAQDVGPGLTMAKDGIYVYAATPVASPCSLIVAQEGVVPGHGPVSTTKIFTEYEGFYTLLLQGVVDMARQGKSLDDIKRALEMPEYADWDGQDCLGVNIDVVYKSVKK